MVYSYFKQKSQQTRLHFILSKQYAYWAHFCHIWHQVDTGLYLGLPTLDLGIPGLPPLPSSSLPSRIYFKRGVQPKCGVQNSIWSDDSQENH